MVAAIGVWRRGASVGGGTGLTLKEGADGGGGEVGEFVIMEMAGVGEKLELSAKFLSELFGGGTRD